MTKPFALALLAFCYVGTSSQASQPGTVASSRTLTVLTDRFEKEFDATNGLAPGARVAAMEETLTAAEPDFYPQSKHGNPGYDAAVAKAIDRFPSIRSRYDEIQQGFPVIFETAITQFRRSFPGFRLSVPVYLLHSLGQMDGGTREYNGKSRLIFGADVIAQIHDADTILPLFDHELFHVENEQNFRECDQLWCSLWEEGLAVYATSVMNPDATDRQLLLTSPKPIRSAVDDHWRDALCDITGKLTLPAGQKAEQEYFTSSHSTALLPARSGYYIGYRVMMRLGKRSRLSTLAHLSRQRAFPLLRRELDAMEKEAGGCAVQQVS